MVTALSLLTACGGNPKTTAEAEKFDYTVEQFADLQILRYRVPGFETLTLQQKKLVYYLTEAALQGRDILGAAMTGSGKTLAFLIPVRSKEFDLF